MIRFDERGEHLGPMSDTVLRTHQAPAKRIAELIWESANVRIGSVSFRFLRYRCTTCSGFFTIDVQPIACPCCGCEFHRVQR